jgi:3-methyladenine DNA glycosylase AlkD
MSMYNVVVNQHHAEFRDLLEAFDASSKKLSKQPKGYEGNNEKSYGLTSPQLKKLVRSWYLKKKVLTFKDFQKLLDSLYLQAESSTEKYIASILLDLYPKHRVHLSPVCLDKWLDKLTGWALIDSLCQSRFSSREMLENWSGWSQVLSNFNTSKNISKRRASLVLLVRSVRESGGEQFAQLALKNIEGLKHEKDILITKAISWLLRDMIKQHRELVEEYLAQNRETLPKVAVREVSNKLKTGKKNSRV